MQIYGVVDAGDAVIVWTTDGREILGNILASDPQAKALIIEAKDGPEAVLVDEIDGIQPLEIPRTFKMISPRNGAAGAGVAAAIIASGNTGAAGGGTWGEGGFMDSINNHYNPPKPPPCRQPTKSMSSTYHPIGQPKDGGCCCGCGGIGMQWN